MNKDRIRTFVAEIFDDMAGAMTAGLAFVGVRTGLFNAMAGQGMLTAQQVVAASGLQLRYVQEWLKGMVCAGYLEYDPKAETYCLPDEHAFLLASEGTDHFAGGLFAMAPALLKVAPEVAQAFKHGGGVEFDTYGTEGIEALDLVNRGNYQKKLVRYWLPQMPAVLQVLQDGGRALDVGCGTGIASIALAEAFGNSTFVGIDLAAKSIELANQMAQEKNLAERVSFFAKPVEQLSGSEKFDFITAFDCVHDLADPQSVLTAIRQRLAPGGTFFVVEPKAADNLEDNMHSVGTMFYGFSVFHCMTQSLANHGPGLGTCMGPRQTETLMREAGFNAFTKLDIKSNVNDFYAVRERDD